MARMTAAEAAVLVMEREGVTQAFGVPGAAINPLYAALRRAQRHRACAGAPRRGRLAHGRRLHPRQGGQYRRLHRHVGAGRHRHDHRPLFGGGGFDPHSLHHRTGAARPALQGGFPGGRDRRDRQAFGEMGGDGARAGAGSAHLPAGVSSDALRPPWPGADRPAVRRADGGDRVRHRDLRTAAGLQAEGDARAGGEGAGDAARGRAAADRRRRRRSSTPTPRTCWWNSRS